MGNCQQSLYIEENRVGNLRNIELDKEYFNNLIFLHVAFPKFKILFRKKYYSRIDAKYDKYLMCILHNSSVYIITKRMGDVIMNIFHICDESFSNMQSVDVQNIFSQVDNVALYYSDKNKLCGLEFNEEFTGEFKVYLGIVFMENICKDYKMFTKFPEEIKNKYNFVEQRTEETVLPQVVESIQLEAALVDKDR